MKKNLKNLNKERNLNKDQEVSNHKLWGDLKIGFVTFKVKKNDNLLDMHLFYFFAIICIKIKNIYYYIYRSIRIIIYQNKIQVFFRYVVL